MTVGRIPSVEGGIQPTIVDAKGDLIVATAADTPARLAVGSANQVLTVDSSTATGLKWAALGAPGGMTQIGSDTTLSGASTTLTLNDTGYKDLVIYLEGAYSASDGAYLYMRLNSDTGNNYGWYTISTSDSTQSGNTTGQIQVGKMRNSATIGTAGYVRIYNYNYVNSVATSSSLSYSDIHTFNGTGTYANSAYISSVTFLPSTGNFSGGTVKVFGVK